MVVSFNRFIKDACTISASALTFYSILSFIPLMALAFALAAGFGAREALEKEFMIQLGDNQEFAGQLLGYVSKAIDHAKGRGDHGGRYRDFIVVGDQGAE